MNRIARIAVPVVAVAAVGTGVAVAAWPDKPSVTADPHVGSQVVATPSSTPSYASASASPSDRSGRTSRDHQRPEISASPSKKASKSPAAKPTTKPSKKAKPSAKPSAKPTSLPLGDIVGSRYTTADLNVRQAPSSHGKVVTVLDTGAKIKITDVARDGYRQVVYQDHQAWVSSDYLSKQKPKQDDAHSDHGDQGSGSQGGGFSSAPCKDGSAVESGLTPDAIRVHRAICARFPQVTAYGGVRGGDGGYHTTGQALDIMVSEPAGWEIARWVRANAKELGASEVIHAQHIWTVQRSSEGWRAMEDRGSPTANHYDHVHVSVYGNAGTA